LQTFPDLQECEKVTPGIGCNPAAFKARYHFMPHVQKPLLIGQVLRALSLGVARQPIAVRSCRVITISAICPSARRRR
ncbi:hypothetical protein BaRGS_00037585, partial [Batillaria attramentaria]